MDGPSRAIVAGLVAAPQQIASEAVGVSRDGKAVLLRETTEAGTVGLRRVLLGHVVVSPDGLARITAAPAAGQPLEGVGSSDWLAIP